MDVKTLDSSKTAATGSTLYSIREGELQACPQTAEHLSVCLIGVTARRLQQLGFQLPDSLRVGRQTACKAALLVSGEDVLQLFKQLLDDYERLRTERDDLRTADNLQRHEIGRLSRQTASLDQQLLMKDKKLAETEYRLEEATHKAEQLRTELRREAQRARIAESEGRRLAETAQHRERRTERELYEARQRLERNGQPVAWRSSRLSRPNHQRHQDGGRGARAAQPSKMPASAMPTAGHAVLPADLFETVDLQLQLMPGSQISPKDPFPMLKRRPAIRNRSLPSMRQQVWYRIPPADEDDASYSTAVSLAETIEASGVCCTSGSPPSSESVEAVTVESSGSRLSRTSATTKSDRRCRGR